MVSFPFIMPILEEARETELGSFVVWSELI